MMAWRSVFDETDHGRNVSVYIHDQFPFEFNIRVHSKSLGEISVFFADSFECTKQRGRDIANQLQIGYFEPVEKTQPYVYFKAGSPLELTLTRGVKTNIKCDKQWSLGKISRPCSNGRVNIHFVDGTRERGVETHRIRILGRFRPGMYGRSVSTPTDEVHIQHEAATKIQTTFRRYLGEKIGKWLKKKRDEVIVVVKDKIEEQKDQMMEWIEDKAQAQKKKIVQYVESKFKIEKTVQVVSEAFDFIDCSCSDSDCSCNDSLTTSSGDFSSYVSSECEPSSGISSPSIYEGKHDFGEKQHDGDEFMHLALSECGSSSGVSSPSSYEGKHDFGEINPGDESMPLIDSNIEELPRVTLLSSPLKNENPENQASTHANDNSGVNSRTTEETKIEDKSSKDTPTEAIYKKSPKLGIPEQIDVNEPIGVAGAVSESERLAEEIGSSGKVRTFSLTFNAAKSIISTEVITNCLRGELKHHIFIFAFQNYQASKSQVEYLVGEALGLEYYPSCYHAIGRLHLVVFVHHVLLPLIHQQCHDSISLGMENESIKTRGAVAISFQIANCSFILVNCHFNANNNMASRLANIKEISARLMLPHGKIQATVPLADRADFVLWMGDFNSRLDAMHHEVEAFLQNGAQSKLIEFDHLKQVMPGYKEGDISFMPSFKYLRGSDKQDVSKIPAWTDRIFCCDNSKSEIIEYNSCMNEKSSTHKPVLAVMKFEIAKPDALWKVWHENQVKMLQGEPSFRELSFRKLNEELDKQEVTKDSKSCVIS